MIPAKVKGLELGLVSHAARDELLDPVARHVQLLEHQLIAQQVGRKVLDLIVAQIDHSQALGMIEKRFGQQRNLVLVQIEQIQIAQLPEGARINVLQLIVLDATAKGEGDSLGINLKWMGALYSQLQQTVQIPEQIEGQKVEQIVRYVQLLEQRQPTERVLVQRGEHVAGEIDRNHIHGYHLADGHGLEVRVPTGEALGVRIAATDTGRAMVPLELAAAGQMPNGLLHGAQPALDLPHALIELGRIKHGANFSGWFPAGARPAFGCLHRRRSHQCAERSIGQRLDQHQQLRNDPQCLARIQRAVARARREQGLQIPLPELVQGLALRVRLQREDQQQPGPWEYPNERARHDIRL